MTAPAFTATKATALMVLADTPVSVRMGMQVRTLIIRPSQLDMQRFEHHT